MCGPSSFFEIKDILWNGRCRYMNCWSFLCVPLDFTEHHTHFSLSWEPSEKPHERGKKTAEPRSVSNACFWEPVFCLCGEQLSREKAPGPGSVKSGRRSLSESGREVFVAINTPCTAHLCIGVWGRVWLCCGVGVTVCGAEKWRKAWRSWSHIGSHDLKRNVVAGWWCVSVKILLLALRSERLVGDSKNAKMSKVYRIRVGVGWRMSE